MISPVAAAAFQIQLAANVPGAYRLMKETTNKMDTTTSLPANAAKIS